MFFYRMSKSQQQNGMIGGGGPVADTDDFSDGESTPLTQDYGDRYVANVSLTKQLWYSQTSLVLFLNGEGKKANEICFCSLRQSSHLVFREKSQLLPRFNFLLMDIYMKFRS